MINKLQVTRQDQENVRDILTKSGAVKGSKVRIVPTGTLFAKAFDIFVNGELFAKYYGQASDVDEYVYMMV